MKAFNTLFRHVLAHGGPVDVVMAGDDAQAKASVGVHGEHRAAPTGRRRPEHGHWVEGAGVLTMGGCGGFVRHRLLASSDTAGHVSVPRMLVCVDTASAPDGCQVVRCLQRVGQVESH